MITNSYLNAIRMQVDVLVRRKRFDKLVLWTVGSDETHDPTLIAQRVYGRRDAVDIVMLCAGTNRIGDAIPMRLIYLPLPVTVAQIKRKYLKQGLSYGG